MGTEDVGQEDPSLVPSGATADKPTRVRYQVLAVLCLLGLLAYVQRVAFASTGIGLKTHLDLNARQWSILMAVFLTAYAGFEIPWGLLGDHVGARHLLAVLVLGWSLLTAALALVDRPFGEVGLTFSVLLILRFFFGIFQAGGFPGISRALADWMPTQERGTAQGLMWMCCRAGGAVAPFVVLTGVAGQTDWRASFVLHGALGVAWCAFFWPWFRNRPEQMSQVNEAERRLIRLGRRARPGGHPPGGVLALLGCRSAWALCLMYGFGVFSVAFFLTMLPSYLREQRRLPVEDMRLLSGLPMACGVAGCLLGGLISDLIIRRWGNRRWGRRGSGLVGRACAGAALLAVPQAEQTWELALLLSAAFFFSDLAMGPAWACCADIGERHAGTLGGAMNMIGNLGGALGTLVAGRLFGKTFVVGEFEFAGNDLLFVLFACSCWLSSLCWLAVDVTKPLSHASA